MLLEDCYNSLGKKMKESKLWVDDEGGERVQETYSRAT